MRFKTFELFPVSSKEEKREEKRRKKKREEQCNSHRWSNMYLVLLAGSLILGRGNRKEYENHGVRHLPPQ